jgi:hypothetical protein
MASDRKSRLESSARTTVSAPLRERSHGRSGSGRSCDAGGVDQVCTRVTAGPSMRCLQMRGAGWERPFSIRITSGTSSTPTHGHGLPHSQNRPRDAGARDGRILMSAQLPGSCGARTRPSITAPRPFSTRSPTHCARKTMGITDVALHCPSGFRVLGSYTPAGP